MNAHSNATQSASSPAVQPDAREGRSPMVEGREGISFSQVAAVMSQTRRKADKTRAGQDAESTPGVPEEKIVHLSTLTGFGDGSMEGEPKSELAGLRKELEQMEKEREEWLHALTELLEEERELQMALELAEARMVPCEWMEQALIELAESRSIVSSPAECAQEDDTVSRSSDTQDAATQPLVTTLQDRIVGLERQLESAREKESAALARAEALESRLARALEQLSSLRAAFEASTAALNAPE